MLSKMLGPQRQPNVLRRAPQENQALPLCHRQVPLTTESAMRKREDNTLVNNVNVKANKQGCEEAL
jgi:hypothetical protein